MAEEDTASMETEEDIINVLNESHLNEKKKSKLRTRILRRIFRQDEISDSTVSPPADLSSPIPYGLDPQTKFECVEISVGSGAQALKGWLMEPTEPIDEAPAIVYSHGVSNTRGASYRIELYKLLLKLGYKVLAYDYRGFADSSLEEPSEDSTVADCRAALSWMRKRFKGGKILCWGHSLGAAITAHAVAEEFQDSKGGDYIVTAVILEAPFNNMVDELKIVVKDLNNVFIRNVVKVFSMMGGLSKMTKDYNISFQSDKWLSLIPCPVLVLAAEDDERIPISLTCKLVDKVTESGKKNVTFKKFDVSQQCGHKYIFKAEELPAIVSKFVQSLF